MRGWAVRDRLRAWWDADRPEDTPYERTRHRAIRRGTVAGMTLVVVGSVVPVPFMVLSPGPTYNTIGEVDGEPVIVISGTTTYPTDGALDMTTVAERGGVSGGVNLGEAMLAWLQPDSSVVPRESIYGPDTTGAEVSARNDQMFALSQSDAIAAAMGELGIATEQAVVVTLVEGGSPADGIVRAGDEVVAVDGKPVQSPDDVVAAVRAHEVGDTVPLTVRRADESGAMATTHLEVVAGASPAGAVDGSAGTADPVAYLGIGVGTRHDAPFDIAFTLQDVGGPSAGMMFSLAIVDMLTEGPMTGGGHVAGTGTIDPEGVVGPIGGITHKLQGARDAGATLFLAPADNCAEVVGHVPDGLQVVPVRTLSEARAAVQAWADDPEAPLASCSAQP